MKSIYYSITQLEDGQWVTITLCETDDLLGAYVPGDYNSYYFHSTEQEALTFVKELQKPVYFDLFGTNYELVELAGGSIELNELFEKWHKFTDDLVELLDMINIELDRPWYVKLYRQYTSKIKGIWNRMLLCG